MTQLIIEEIGRLEKRAVEMSLVDRTRGRPVENMSDPLLRELLSAPEMDLAFNL